MYGSGLERWVWQGEGGADVCGDGDLLWFESIGKVIVFENFGI